MAGWIEFLGAMLRGMMAGPNPLVHPTCRSHEATPPNAPGRRVPGH